MAEFYLYVNDIMHSVPNNRRAHKNFLKEKLQRNLPIAWFLLLQGNTIAKSKQGRKGFIRHTFPHHSTSMKKARTGDPNGLRSRRQELMKSTLRNAASWISPFMTYLCNLPS